MLVEVESETIPHQSHMAIRTQYQGKEQIQGTTSKTLPLGKESLKTVVVTPFAKTSELIKMPTRSSYADKRVLTKIKVLGL